MRASIVTSALLIALAGCQTTQFAGIPLGHWSGTGRLVAIPEGEAATQPQPEARPYETTLDIRKGSGASTGKLVFEIVSKRGKIEGLDGDRTHLIFELDPGQDLDGGRIRLFRITRAGVSLDAAAPTMEEGPPGVVNATSIGDGAETSLHVIYRPGEWRDVFLFRGDRLTKAGTLEGLEDENSRRRVCWVEELTRR